MRPADETSAEINALSENRVMQKCMSFLIHGAWGPIWNHSRRGGLHKGTRLCENPPGPPGTASVIATWGVQTSWNRLPKGLLQRSRAHGISESTTIHSRPKSQASHTAKFDSGLLFTQSGTVLQQPGDLRVFNGSCVAKRYCIIDSIGNTFCAMLIGYVW